MIGALPKQPAYVVIAEIAARLMLKQISMNTQKLGIPSTVRSSDDHLIPAHPSIPPSLIERLAASHAAVLKKWDTNFALDLRRPKALPT
jgi:hypothetical protein